MSRVCLSDDGCLGLRQCFTDLDAVVPRVITLGVVRTSAVSEPRTTATTTTNFLRFCNDAAFGACGTDARRRGCWCVYVVIGETQTWNHKKDTDQSVRGSIYMTLALDLHLQASTPSDHL